LAPRPTIGAGGFRLKKKQTIQSVLGKMFPKPQPPMPYDLNNQKLSDDPLERIRQLEWQAQKDEQRLSGQ
jgi:hypothetical protein